MSFRLLQNIIYFLGIPSFLWGISERLVVLLSTLRLQEFLLFCTSLFVFALWLLLKPQR